MTSSAQSMTVVSGIDALEPRHGRLLFAVGVFDGLHRGHAYLLDALREAARRRGARPAVITFDAHPDEVLVGSAPPLLLDPEDRLERLAAAGVALTVVQHFDATLRATSYRDFVGRIAARVDLAGFLMTPDAAFGHERAGTPEALAALGKELGFEVDVVPVLAGEGGPIRSSEIRAAIVAGDLEHAAEMLGREVSIVGRSAEGAGDAATELGFALPVGLPPPGTYRVLVEQEGEAVPVRRRLVVGGTGSARLEPRVDAPAGARIRVRLPTSVEPATIRRS
jgi:riboflavin kinase/FMN adenylyltransferase